VKVPTLKSIPTCRVLDFDFARLTLAECLAWLQNALESDAPQHVVTANPEIVMLARKNPQLKRIMLNSPMITADGTGIVWAAKLLGRPLPMRVTGVDLTDGLLTMAAAAGLSVGLLGGKPGVAEAAAIKMRQQYPGLSIPVVLHGYLQDSDPAVPARLMRDSGVSIVLVAMGAPRQEEWISSHQELSGAKILVGIGGVLDIWAGCQRRAPALCCRWGMEWAWRMFSQPSRIVRGMAIPAFVAEVFKERLRQKAGDQPPQNASAPKRPEKPS
jgi:N-acetylglucosaminyldiphosphoundecaprenol N-acetyl-beta-D-mannosaminyltransferase